MQLKTKQAALWLLDASINVAVVLSVSLITIGIVEAYYNALTAQMLR